MMITQHFNFGSKFPQYVGFSAINSAFLDTNFQTKTFSNSLKFTELEGGGATAPALLGHDSTKSISNQIPATNVHVHIKESEYAGVCSYAVNHILQGVPKNMT